MRCMFALSCWSSSMLFSILTTPPLFPEVSTFSGYRSSPRYQTRGKKAQFCASKFLSHSTLLSHQEAILSRQLN